MQLNPQEIEEVGSGGLRRLPVAIHPLSISAPAASTSPWSPLLTLAVVVALGSSTGSYAHANALSGKSFRPQAVEESRNHHEASSVDQIPYTAEQLSDLRNVFGLNVSELANVMRVQRPTIYQWQRGTKLRPKNARRLGELHDIATEYREKAVASAARYLHAPQGGAPALFDLLRTEVLNRHAIESVLDRVVARQARRSTLHKRISAAAERFEFEDVSRDEQNENLGQLSSSIS